MFLDELADIPRSRKHHRGTIAAHAGADQHRLARGGAGSAGVGLEAQVELPVRKRLSARERDEIAVLAVADRRHLVFRSELSEVLWLSRSHHPAHHAVGGWRGAFRAGGLEERNQMLARPRVLDPGEYHQILRDEFLRVLEPGIERLIAPYHARVL